MNDDPDDFVDAEVIPPANPFQDLPDQPSHAPNPYASPAPVRDIGDDTGMRMLLPVGRSPWAIISGYMALFTPFMCLTSPVALITGIMAVRQIKREPKLHGLGRAWFGIIVGALGCVGLVFFVVMTVIGVLADR